MTGTDGALAATVQSLRAASILRRSDTAEGARSLAATVLAHRKYEAVGKRAVRIQCAQAAKAFWDRLTPEEKQREMRRRRKIGLLRKKQKALGVVK